MAFNSFSFWLVFPFIFGIYWLIPAKWNQYRKIFLVLASYLLYMNWKPAFALVLLGVTLITYWGVQVFDSERDKNKELKVGKRKRLIWVFALLGLLPLLVLWFSEPMHLNGDGAREYSKMIAGVLPDYMR